MREVSQVTLLYAQVPLALLSNPRVRDLPPSAELTLFRLYLHAALCSSTRDTIPLPRGVAYAQAVRTLVGEHVDRMDALVSAGLVAYEADALRLTLTPSTPHDAQPSRAEAPAEAPTPAGKPSDTPAAERARNDRKKFTRRLSPFAHVADGVVWESWIATPEGAAFVSERESTFRGYRERAVPTAVPNAGTAPRYRPGTAPVPPPGTALPSHTLPSGNAENKREEEDARGTAVPPPGTGTGTAQGTAPTPSILSGLQAAAKGATLTGALAMEREANATLARITPPLTADEIEDMGAALANPFAWWPPGKKAAPKHITLRDLAGWRGDDGAHDWTPLMALVAHAREEDDDGYINRPDPPRPPQYVKILQGDEITRALEEAETTGPFAWALRGRKRATVQSG